jgi:soluble lytic murein transglycosylase-like protein
MKIDNLTKNNLTDNINPVKVENKISKDNRKETIERKIRFLKAPERDIKELTGAIDIVSRVTNKHPDLIIAIMSTESEFKRNAVSSKGYKGLMQTPRASFEHLDVDTLYGVRILEEKLKTTDGDLLKALALYKGGNNPLARKYAKQTYELYHKLRNMED